MATRKVNVKIKDFNKAQEQVTGLFDQFITRAEKLDGDLTENLEKIQDAKAELQYQENDITTAKKRNSILISNLKKVIGFEEILTITPESNKEKMSVKVEE